MFLYVLCAEDAVHSFISVVSRSGCLQKVIKEKWKEESYYISFLISVIYFGRNFLKRWLIALDEDPNSACETCTTKNEF